MSRSIDRLRARQAERRGDVSIFGANAKKVPSATGLVAAAQQASIHVPLAVLACIQRSRKNGGQYLSSPMPASAASPLGSIAKSSGASAALVSAAVQFDQAYAAMLNGTGWAAVPNSGTVDNTSALQSIGTQLAQTANSIAWQARVKKAGRLTRTTPRRTLRA